MLSARTMAQSAALPMVLAALSTGPLRAQTIEDGALLPQRAAGRGPRAPGRPGVGRRRGQGGAPLWPRRALRTGLLYARDSWSNYWEGGLKRDNENIGTVTTQSVTWMAAYGVTDRLSVMAALPYVWTHASQGPLHGMRGLQDVTFAAKYRLLSTPFTDRGGPGAA